MTIEKYKYPNNIDKDDFKYRQVIFLALTGTGNLAPSKNNIEDFSNANTDQLLATVTLPLTSNISDSQDHSWSSTDYYSVITGAVKAGLDTLNNGKKDEGIISSFLKITELVKSGMEGPFEAALADMQGRRRVMLNPGYFQYYTGSNLRSFDFTFDFIPENEEETKSVINIIKAFKAYSSPSRPLIDQAVSVQIGAFDTNKIPMLSPCQWMIYVQNEKISELLSFHKCVCTRVSVTYGDSDKVAMFDDGMPKQITLSLSFSETELQFADSYGVIPFTEDQTKKAKEYKEYAQKINNMYKESKNHAGALMAALDEVLKNVFNMF